MRDQYKSRRGPRDFCRANAKLETGILLNAMSLNHLDPLVPNDGVPLSLPLTGIERGRFALVVKRNQDVAHPFHLESAPCVLSRWTSTFGAFIQIAVAFKKLHTATTTILKVSMERSGNRIWTTIKPEVQRGDRMPAAED